MFNIFNIILDVVSVAGMIACGVMLVFYIAAALAVADARDVMDQIDKWLHRR